MDFIWQQPDLSIHLNISLIVVQNPQDITSHSLEVTPPFVILVDFHLYWKRRTSVLRWMDAT